MKKGVKKALCVALAAGMIVPMAACGSKGGSAEKTGGDAKTQTTKSGGEGKVLNIQCWNDEFARRLRDHYPDFKPTDKENPTKGGTIGDVKVKFTVTPSDNNAYQNNLDEVLPKNADAKDDSKVDLFLIEADYARKYINTKTPVTEKIADL
ncbi:MAG: carbohydrate ABC transporter substrate-binding protein, partial [Lachnospiraceae bacterium]|nr:carbohydrate ABC transporter substrate-binding protein [Lachnospiraceae bacterium]